MPILDRIDGGPKAPSHFVAILRMSMLNEHVDAPRSCHLLKTEYSRVVRRVGANPALQINIPFAYSCCVYRESALCFTLP
jgi:hypothetical protein